jgi:hypothetical protein
MRRRRNKGEYKRRTIQDEGKYIPHTDLLANA